MHPFSKNINQFLTAFNLSELHYEEAKSGGMVHEATGSSLPTSKVYFAMAEPFSGLPLLRICDDELPWDRVKRQTL